MKAFSDGEYIKECLEIVASSVCPEKLSVFGQISLSRQTVTNRIADIAREIEETLLLKAKRFEWFSLALDESTDLTNTAQLSVFVRGIDSDFNVTEEIATLGHMKVTTKGEDILHEVNKMVDYLDLDFSELSGIAADGAPAMVGASKGLVGLIKKQMLESNLNVDELYICHCIIHQENLCAKSIQFQKVMSIVVSVINFIKSRASNNRQFKTLLQEVESEYSDLAYYCEVRWLIRAEMLLRFYELRSEINIFMSNKGRPVAELDDEKWLTDLAFLTDITHHLSDLNKKLQGPNQLINDLYSHIKTFENKFKMWVSQLSRGDLTNFKILSKHSPNKTALEEYTSEVSTLQSVFSERFADFRAYDPLIKVFSSPFDIDADDAPSKFQMELLELQGDDYLKSCFVNTPHLLDFYEVNISSSRYPNIRKHALKMASLFGTTYISEQFFSKMKIAKCKQRARLTDDNFTNELRIATSSIDVDLCELAKKKQKQISH